MHIPEIRLRHLARQIHYLEDRPLYRWLEGRDILVVRADRREPLVVVRIDLATQVARATERARGGGR
jgi:hypothetical protein